MQSMDYEVLRKAHTWITEGHAAYLATVVRTWGSAPRPTGSLMAVRGDGQVVGSVSGGCIEDHLVEQLRQGVLRPDLPLVMVYGADGEESRRFNIPCGGTLQIVLEPLSEKSGLDRVASTVAERNTICREVDLRTGAVTLHASVEHTEFHFNGEVLRAEFGPRHRLLLIGAGQVTRYLAEMAQALDYAVEVCEPREEYLGSWELEQVPLSREMPDDWILSLDVDEKTAIVALTHDPKLDDMGLLEALISKAFYVGAIGSRRNSEARKQRLMKYFDLRQEQVSRLHGPVGLHIGAATPPEIAISVLAEITAIRRGIEIVQRRPAAPELAADEWSAKGNSACFRV